MKLVIWNCKSKFREKFHLLSQLDADILIISECENPETSTSQAYREWAKQYRWIGLYHWKGLGVFAKEGICLELCDWNDYLFRNYLPLKINGQYTLLALWAQRPYIEDVLKYLSIHYDKINQDTIIAGDFNSSVIWDVKHDFRNHSYLNHLLARKNLFSVYHTLNEEAFGQEVHSTFFMYHKSNKPYYIDYCYCRKDLMKSCSVLDSKNWLTVSDHTPIFIELEL